jgi:hypothetical protein
MDEFDPPIYTFRKWCAGCRGEITFAELLMRPKIPMRRIGLLSRKRRYF